MVAPLGKERGYIDEQLTQRGLRRQAEVSALAYSPLTHVIYPPHRLRGQRSV
jgi:hypothetical protein